MAKVDIRHPIKNSLKIDNSFFKLEKNNLMFRTSIYTFISKFIKEKHTAQKLIAKNHLSKAKGTNKKTILSCNDPLILNLESEYELNNCHYKLE